MSEKNGGDNYYDAEADSGYVPTKKASLFFTRKVEEIGGPETEESFLLQGDKKKSYGDEHEEEKGAGHGHGHGGHGHGPQTPMQKILNNAKIIIISGFLLFTIVVFALEETHDESPLSELRGVSFSTPIISFLTPAHSRLFFSFFCNSP